MSILKLPTLECRRAYNDLICLYKIIHELSDISFQNIFPPTAFNSNPVLGRHPHALIYLNTSFIIAQLKPRILLLSVYAVRPLWHLLKKYSCPIYVKLYLIYSILCNELKRTCCEVILKIQRYINQGGQKYTDKKSHKSILVPNKYVSTHYT